MSALLTLPRTELTLHNALRIGGRFYFLTAVKSSPVTMELTTAQVPLTACTLWREENRIDEHKRPIRVPAQKVCAFPAVLTEKYTGFAQGEPMARTEIIYVLVTPKLILLEVGDIVEASGKKYAVQACHLLDEYKNEYEIARKDDV